MLKALREQNRIIKARVRVWEGLGVGFENEVLKVIDRCLDKHTKEYNKTIDKRVKDYYRNRKGGWDLTVGPVKYTSRCVGYKKEYGGYRFKVQMFSSDPFGVAAEIISKGFLKLELDIVRKVSDIEVPADFGVDVRNPKIWRGHSGNHQTMALFDIYVVETNRP